MTIKNILVVSLLLLTCNPSIASIPIVKGEIWTASDGKHINCHGGGIIKMDDTYYWYGENRETSGQLPAVMYSKIQRKSARIHVNPDALSL